LGLFGIRSYSDFSGMIKSAQQDVAPKLEQAKRQADEIRQTSAGLKAQYDELKTELSDTRALAQDVKTLSKKVERIEEKVGFKPSAALTPDLQKDLEAALSSFIGYMQKIGFRPLANRVNVYVDPDMKDNVAYYKPDESLVVVGRPYAKDTDAVFREYAFHVLSGSNFGALTLDARAIESGLADYFPCSYKNNPIFGEEIASHIRELQGPEAFKQQYVRNLKNERKFTESWRERGYQEGGEIWGGAFWEIRSLLGRDIADKVLFTAWHSTEARAGQTDAVTYFVKQLLESDRSLEDEKHVNQITSVFERRGLKF